MTKHIRRVWLGAALFTAVFTLVALMGGPVGAVTGLTITSPTEASPVVATAPDYVTVAYGFTPAGSTTPGALSADVEIRIYKTSAVGLVTIGTKSVTITGLTGAVATTSTASVYIEAAAADGEYDVSVSVDDGVAPVSAIQVDAVEVDTGRPTVVISVGAPWVTASGTSTVIATFSKPMATGVSPTITFTPAFTSTSTMVAGTGVWSVGNTVLTVPFTFGDNDEVRSDVDVSVGGAEDPVGNVQSPNPTIGLDLLDVDQVQPILNTLAWTDVDSSRGIGAGDTLLLTFSKAMDTSTAATATLATDLVLSAGSYGTGATVDWGTPVGDDTLTITLGVGTTILSGATVDPAATVTDVAGNGVVAGTKAITDLLGPRLASITWWDLDASTTINAADTLVFTFGEDITTGTVTTANVATALLLSSGTYGTGATVNWAAPAGNDDLTVTLGTSASILLTDTVNPADTVTDVATNADATVAPGTGIVQGVIVSIDAPATVVPGATVAVDVTITNVSNLDAGNFTVGFDTDVLTLASISAGSIGGTAIPVSAYVVGTDTVTVTVNVLDTPGVSGVGTLATLNFTFVGVSGEQSTLALSGGSLSDNTAAAVNAQWVNPTAPVAATLVVGDANGDGNLNALDITKIELDIANGRGVWTAPSPGTTEAAPGADANIDGAINSLDITRIELLVAG
ncbi:hypothetical protein HQ590_07720 [bacterium]|nr:hypothetical protein [bacterium]